MKLKIFMFFILMFCGLGLFAQANYQDVIYLKDGTVTTGVILDQYPGKSVKIKASDGSILNYNMSNIYKMTREEVETPKQQQPSKEIESKDDRPSKDLDKEESNDDGGSRFSDVTKRPVTFYSLFTFNMIFQNIKANQKVFTNENGIATDKMSMGMRGDHSSFGTAVLGYNFGITSKIGLGFETGLMFEFFHGTPNFMKTSTSGNYTYSHKYDVTMNQIGISMPINATYNFQINRKFSVFASSGFLLNVGLWYGFKCTDTEYEYYDNNLINTDQDYTDADYYTDEVEGSKSLNRVNLFYTMGVGVKFSRFRLKMERGWGLTNLISYSSAKNSYVDDIHCKFNRPFTLS